MGASEVLRSARQSEPAPVVFGDEPYAEVEIADSPGGQASSAPAQAVRPAIDHRRLLFYSMRQLAHEGPQDRSQTFYRQAMFMKDFDDDYDKEAPFSSYYPYYQQMGYDQLRAYFSWRTGARRGEVGNTSLSCAFLYVYELLNQVGVADPEEGLQRLLDFWQAFRVHGAALDSYLLQWLKDYHVFYPLRTPFGEFAAERGLQIHYPAIFGYRSGPEDSFALFSGISQYDIRKSIFYTEERRELVNDCFYFVLTRFRALFGKIKKCFEDQIFYLQKRKSRWIPFDKALFYPAYRQHDRVVQLSEREEYTCKDQIWTFKTALVTDHGRQLIGYIFKEMEANLRAREKFKYKLTASLGACKAVNPLKYQELGIPFSQVIREAVAEFYTIATRREVSVDLFNLAQIRRDALHTQEKLLVPEEEGPAAPPAPEVVTPLPPPAADGWSALGAALTATEREALRCILQGRDIGDFALKNSVMPEVLVDGINDKAMDTVGDAVLELDDTVSVYEEYRENLMEMVER